jgi:hypothetical protein
MALKQTMKEYKIKGRRRRRRTMAAKSRSTRDARTNSAGADTGVKPIRADIGVKLAGKDIGTGLGHGSEDRGIEPVRAGIYNRVWTWRTGWQTLAFAAAIIIRKQSFRYPVILPPLSPSR